MLRRKNIINIVGMGCLCLSLLGCREESFLVQEDSSTIVLEEEVIFSKEALKEKDNGRQVSFDDSTGKVLGNSQDGNSETAKEAVKTEDRNSEAAITEEKIAVHICGAVNQPGVYYLKKGQRLYEGIQKAGGFREEADVDYLNQAMGLEDGMKITVPTKEEIKKMSGKDLVQAEAENVGNVKHKAADNGADTYIQKEEFTKETAIDSEYLQENKSDGKNEFKEQNGKIDLNTADETQLCTLPGIGESRAKSIIAYRQEHGLFQKTEDVMKVSGIKEAAFEKIKDYVIVSD